MKKIFKIFLIITVLFSINVKALELDINSNNAILINLNEDTVLYEKNSEEKTSIASLTKIMTAIVVLDKVDNLDEKIKLTYEDFKGLAEENAAVAGFKVGQTVTYRDLLYALLLPSGADAAQALSRNIAGSKEKFVELMNIKVKELKLENTHFVNPTGLDQKDGYSTVKDVSIMFKYAIKNKDFLEIIKTDKYTTSDKTLTFKSTLTSKKNNLNMDYLIGGKTGTTLDAGLCLASLATYDNVDYMLVTANTKYTKTNPLNFLDAKKIYEYFINNYGYKVLINKNDILVKIKTKNSTKDEIKFKAQKEIKKYLKNDFKKENVKIKYKGLKELSYKNKLGEKIGKVDIYYNNEKIDTIDIVLKEQIKFDLKKYIMNNKEIIIGILIGLILIIFLLRKLRGV